MKHLFTCLTASLLAIPTLCAQTLKVYTGHVVTAFPATSAGQISFADEGKTFTVNGAVFHTENVDSIKTDNSPVESNKLSVNYAPQGTWVTVSGDVASLLQVSVRGNHVSVEAAPTLAQEVTYALSGNCGNGSFYMDGEFKSTLLLDGLNLTNPDSAAVNIANGKRIKVVLPEGTATTLADGTGGLQKACLFINGHAEFEGAGTLNVTGNSRHAYASDEYTLLTEGFGTINILGAASDGMHVDQYFQMDGGKVVIRNVKGDNIDVSITKDPTDEFNGMVFINAGTLDMEVAADDTKGLKNESDMTVSGGTVIANVSANGGKGISVGGNLLVEEKDSSKPTSISMEVSGTTYHKGMIDESKCRGIKVKGNYTLAGGNIQMRVTGEKAKGISIDGIYSYTGGKTNVQPE